MVGRINPRDAGRRPLDPRTLLMAILLVVVVASALTAQISMLAAAKLGTVDAEIPVNPLTTLALVLRGRLAWPPVATVVAATLWIVLIAVTVSARKAIPKRSKTSFDDAQQYLAPKEDVDSLSKKEMSKKARRFVDDELAQNNPGIRMGKAYRTKKYLYSSWEDLYLIIFGPRGGKTSAEVIPAIVEAPGVVVTTSIRRDIVDETIGVTSARGNVWVFDPQDIASGIEAEDWFFDPLDIIRINPDTMDVKAYWLADIFQTANRPDDSTGVDPFFAPAARNLLTALLLAAALDNRPISVVNEWAGQVNDLTPVGILEAYPQWEHWADSLRSMYNTVSETRDGFFKQAQTVTQELSFGVFRRWTTPDPRRHRFDINAFVRSKADTLYVLSKNDGTAPVGLTTALVSSVMKAAERYGDEVGGPSGRLPVPLVAPLDEAANLVRWPELPELYSHYGGRGIILMTILQSYSQGEQRWGQHGMRKLWGSASMRLIGGGVVDDILLDMAVKLLGNKVIWEKSYSYNDGNASVSASKHETNILDTSQIARIPQGIAILLSSFRAPIIINTVPWWERSYSKEIMQLLPGKR